MFSEKTRKETLLQLKTDENRGLQEQEAKQRLKQYGPNMLKDEEGRTFIERLLSQFMDPLIYVLLAAGVISVFLGETADAVIIGIVVLVNGMVGVIQEGKAQKALEELKKMTRLRTIVRRDGIEREVDAAELVPGDLVILQTGRQVPADIRLLVSENMRVEEAALTGESLPVRKDAAFIGRENLPVGDQKNMAFMSTNVTAGRGEGIVTATGMHTELGKIAGIIRNVEEDATPLQKRLGDLGTLLSVLAVGLCFVLFIVAVIQERDVGEMLITAISLAVAAVPEGLPAVVTIVLALSVTRMVKVHTIVRRLPSVETLGAVTVVCTDKTGTLTKNRMTVEHMQTAADILGGRSDQNELLRAFCCCNDATITGENEIGDPTELALLAYGRRIADDGTLTSWSKQYRRVAERAFDSERKMMTTVHEGPDGTVSYTKGAPDIVISRCDHYRSEYGVRKLSRNQKLKILEHVAQLSADAYRLLAAAYSDGDGRSEEKMVLLGIAAMTDPPREEAAHAVSMFRKAGVRTIMITGDHKDTALAIARKLSIAKTKEQCISGEELEQLDDYSLAERLRRISVFARVSSMHKTRIVQALKADGNVVAMTGDGVNDAPALKAADVGIAMGKSGTDVAKQAADLVLTDDNFATIEKAMEEGRGIYENIKKSVIFLLSSNFGEIMTMFFAVLFSLPSPLKASHILWINLITDSLPALALGVDQNDGESLMAEPPRGTKEGLFARGGLVCTFFYGALIAAISLMAFLRIPHGILMNLGLPASVTNMQMVLGDPQILLRCQTYAFTVLGMSQLFHAVGMRDVRRSVFRMNHRENLLMLAAVVIGVLLQASVTEVPVLVSMFQTAPLSGDEWKELLGFAAMPMIAHELLILLGNVGNLQKKS